MRVGKYTYHFLTTIFSVVWILLAGQNSTPYVEGKLGTDSIYIGSQTNITLSIASPEDYLWQWPVLTDKITEKIEIVTQTGIDTIRQRRSDLLILKKQLSITSFDSGFHAVPSFTFQYKAPDDTIWSALKTKPSLIYVAGMKADLNIPIRDIKEPMRAPITFLEILPWLLLVIFIIAGVFLYRRYLKRKEARLSLLPKPLSPKIPPHTKALDALEQLRQKKLWQSGRIKEYHSEITDILRRYLEDRYRIMAVEMSTSEIMEAALTHQVFSQAREKLLMVFEMADLVKFAKSIPLPGEHERSFMLALEFVRDTVPVAVKVESRMGSENQSGMNSIDEKK